MERLTIALIFLGGLFTAGFLWHCFYASNSQAASGYQWDYDGPCINPTEKAACPPTQAPTPIPVPPKTPRVCDGKGLTPALRCQLKIMSKTPPRTACQVFSNPYRLPNLASFYIGARASVLKNTTTYSGCQSGWGWCDDGVFLRGIIQPGLLIVGKNYRFQGKRGSIVIELAEPAFISGVTLIHPLACEIPNGYHTSAPKQFTVYGLPGGGGGSVDDEPLELGRYVYKIGGPRAQTFSVQSKCIGKEAHKRVMINFEDNYGNPYYTAIYKFEVHGLLGGASASCSSCD